MSKFHSLKIDLIKRLTPEAVRIDFKIPESSEAAFQFKAGQYLTIKHDYQGQEIRRDYSICSSPTSNKLQIGVKEVKNGVFSNFANNELQVGSNLEIMPPNGRFTYTSNPNNKGKYVAIAAGSGITPILSIITNALETESESCFLLIYGNRNMEQTMFLSDIQELQEKYPERLYLEMVYSQERIASARFGRIDRSIINFFLKNKYKDYTPDCYYLCGPGDLIEQTIEVLKDSGVEENKILFELFTSPQASGKSKPIMAEGKTNITVVLDDEETAFVMNQSNVILDVTLDAGIDAPYSCRGGICSTCLAKIIEGEAVMRKNQILTDQEVEDGYILTCQAQPTSSSIKISYDDI